MRVVFFPPSPEEFKVLLESSGTRNGGGLEDISVFTPSLGGIIRRRGGGIFSTVAKNVIPFLFKTIKPVVQEFGQNVARDVLVEKKNIKSSLKKRGLQSLAKTGKKILKSIAGGGKRRPLTKRKTKRLGKKRSGSSSRGRGKKRRDPIKDVYSLLT